MKVIGIIGKKRAGKTTITANFIKQLNRPRNFIYDVNNEYERKLNIKNDYTGKIDIESFLAVLDPDKPNAVKNACIVFEEATSYFSSKGRENILIKIISRSRHYNNAVILIFHSLGGFPPYIYPFIDYVVLFKTNDFYNTLDNKFRKNEQFIKKYNEVKLSNDPHKFVFFENEG